MDQEKKTAAPKNEAERPEAEKDALLSDDDLDEVAGGKLRLVSSANRALRGKKRQSELNPRFPP